MEAEEAAALAEAVSLGTQLDTVGPTATRSRSATTAQLAQREGRNMSAMRNEELNRADAHGMPVGEKNDGTYQQRWKIIVN